MRRFSGPRRVPATRSDPLHVLKFGSQPLSGATQAIFGIRSLMSARRAKRELALQAANRLNGALRIKLFSECKHHAAPLTAKNTARILRRAGTFAQT